MHDPVHMLTTLVPQIAYTLATWKKIPCPQYTRMEVGALPPTLVVGQKRHFKGDKEENGSEGDLENKRVKFLEKTDHKHTLTAEAGVQPCRSQ